MARNLKDRGRIVAILDAEPLPDPTGMSESAWFVRNGAPLTVGVTLTGRF